MLQLAKRLAHHVLRPPLAVSRYILATCKPDAVSDGCDAGGFGQCNDVTTYLGLLEAVGSETLPERSCFAPRPRRGAPWSTTRSCRGRAAWRRLLHPAVRRQAWCPYPGYFEVVMSQFKGLELADDVLVNSFYELEPEEAAYMASAWRAKTIGPTVPASYVGDDRMPSDTKYGFHLFELTAAPCVSWLSAHPARSVVFASFGSLSNLDPAEMREVAHGLLDAGRPFLWAVRESESHKLPAGYGDAVAASAGMLVPWCPQLEVLAHPAVGCFLTHCG
ncbi:UDP-glycosyltransferase 74F2-like [Hordeum vulgare]|nr:UDP-glycosyltransferase 74F2-like [Hordeum vulgare]